MYMMGTPGTCAQENNKPLSHWPALHTAAMVAEAAGEHANSSVQPGKACLADAAAQVAVAGRHNVALVLLDALADAVICVCAAVHAGQDLQPRVLQST
jgi:hypothetical protein